MELSSARKAMVWGVLVCLLTLGCVTSDGYERKSEHGAGAALHAWMRQEKVRCDLVEGTKGTISFISWGLVWLDNKKVFGVGKRTSPELEPEYYLMFAQDLEMTLTPREALRYFELLFLEPATFKRTALSVGFRDCEYVWDTRWFQLEDFVGGWKNRAVLGCDLLSVLARLVQSDAEETDWITGKDSIGKALSQIAEGLGELPLGQLPAWYDANKGRLRWDSQRMRFKVLEQQ